MYEDFTTLYKELYPVVLIYLLKCTNGDRHLAEDLANDTFIKILKRFDDIDQSEGKMRRYVFMAARNKFYEYKASKYDSKILSRQSYIYDDPLKFIQISDYDRNPLELLISKESNQKAIDAINELPDNVRDMVKLFYIDGLRIPEITKQTKMNQNTVKGRIFNGRKKLAKKLKPLKLAS